MLRASRNGTSMSTNEDSISDTLGEKFQIFVEMMKGGLEQFTFEKSSKGEIGQSSKSPKGNDIHYDFTEYFVSAVDAFKKIETPIIEKHEIAQNFAENITNIFNELTTQGYTSGASSSASLSEFRFFSLPYKHADSKIKYLVKGFNLLPFNENIYFDTGAAKGTVFINAIRYLRHFIALLDLTSGTNGKDVINFLRGNFVFRSYVDNIYELLTKATEYFGKGTAFPDAPETKSFVIDGIYHGLAEIANNIIDEFKNKIAPLSNEKFIDYRTFEQLKVDKDTKLDNVNPGSVTPDADVEYWIYQYLTTGSNSTNRIALANKIGPIIYALKQLRKKGDDATAKKITGIQPKDVENYGINALYNPIFMDDSITEKEVDPANENIGPNIKQIGGGPGDLLDAPTGTKFVSLPYLYGPLATDNKYHRVDDKVQGALTDKADMIDAANVKAISDAVAEIEKLSNSPNQNWERIILLQIIAELIENDKAVIDANFAFKKLTVDDQKNIVKRIKTAFDNYKILQPRLVELAKDKDFVTSFKNKKYSELFANSFVLFTSQNLEMKDNKISKRGAEMKFEGKKENTLADPEIKNFFFDYVIKNKEFYQDFFNLMRTEVGADSQPIDDNVPFNAVSELKDNDTELKKYRLNVKKISGFTTLRGGCRAMRGGAFGDIVLLSRIPPYISGGNIAGIWLTRNIYVSADKLAQFGSDAIARIGRVVYYRKPGDAKVQIYGVTINVNDMVAESHYRTYFNINYPDLFQDILRDADPYTLKPSAMWKSLDIALSEDMLRRASEWERVWDSSSPDYGNFVRKDKEGNKIIKDGDGTCAFMESVTSCTDILYRCASSPIKDGELAKSCEKIMDLDINIPMNPAMNDVAARISKMNPRIAYKILRQFKFGSYLSDKETQPFKGIRRYRVQSVADWLREMGAGGDRCKEPVATVERPCNPKSLKEQLGENAVKKIIAYAQDPNKRRFFDYLQVLVSWVNANWQVLNPEEFLEVGDMGGNWPEENKSFRTYDYLNPYSKINIKMKNLSCGLERLKSGIINDTAGARGADLMSAVASVPLGIEMPLARPGFTYAVPSVGFSGMYGGSNDVEAAFKNVSQQYGYELFREIFNYLKQTMSNLQKNKIKLKSTTETNITEKLEKFRLAEEELRKSLINLIERNQLYRASRGFINAYDMNDDDFKKVLEKHSNLLHISSAYNRKARNLIDLFQTIAKAITDKIDSSQSVQSSSSGQAYTRPVAPTYYTNY